MTNLLLSVFLSIIAFGVAPAPGVRTEERTLSGIVYFTNNTPRDRNTFPVELYTRDQKRLVVAATLDAHGQFELGGVKPCKYLLKFTWPNRCTLRYRVDVRKASLIEIKVIMDAACAHEN